MKLVTSRITFKAAGAFPHPAQRVGREPRQGGF
jgi:hypothetical protein